MTGEEWAHCFADALIASSNVTVDKSDPDYAVEVMEVFGENGAICADAEASLPELKRTLAELKRTLERQREQIDALLQRGWAAEAPAPAWRSAMAKPMMPGAWDVRLAPAGGGAG